VAASGLLLANGINLSRDGRHVYVAQTSGRELKTYERDPYSGGLTEVGELAIPAGPDNIDVAGDGSLWLAGHANLFAARDRAKRAASEIFRIETVDGVPRSARPIYADAGGAISGASVGAVSGRHLFIGSALDNKVLDCTMGR
jgi:arylesterase/paraoxonase